MLYTQEINQINQELANEFFELENEAEQTINEENLKMKKFTVYVHVSTITSIEVEANSQKEANELANKMGLDDSCIMSIDLSLNRFDGKNFTPKIEDFNVIVADEE